MDPRALSFVDKIFSLILDSWSYLPNASLASTQNELLGELLISLKPLRNHLWLPNQKYCMNAWQHVSFLKAIVIVDKNLDSKGTVLSLPNRVIRVNNLNRWTEWDQNSHSRSWYHAENGYWEKKFLVTNKITRSWIAPSILKSSTSNFLWESVGSIRNFFVLNTFWSEILHTNTFFKKRFFQPRAAWAEP